ncbi:hypothetical protein ACL02V_29490 [Bacillus mobilis]|uniref:hypothetical protein n=1 Tax=Bacillus mobilis TaxID=2026190 RepID=UPI0039A06868
MEEYEGLHSIKESWKIFFINLTICIATVLLVGFGVKYAHGLTEKEEIQNKIHNEQTGSNSIL